MAMAIYVLALLCFTFSCIETTLDISKIVCRKMKGMASVSVRVQAHAHDIAQK